MSEYIVNFGDTSSPFVGLAMAEVEHHGASIGKQIVRCRDCAKWATEKRFTGGCRGAKGDADPDGYCSWGERKAVGHDAREWFEWECPHCRRYGQVNPSREYEDGEHWAQECSMCGAEIVVLCSYEPAFYAYRKESWKEARDD